MPATPSRPIVALASPRRRFAVALAIFTASLLWYGCHRLSLGVDFTDEGAYVAWPLRTLFGEKPFTGEVLTLVRPIFFYVAWIYRLCPDITLYELRLLGWLIHVASFCILATYLFRICRAPLQSLLVACIPFFICHIFGLAPPSYNSLSSDFLLIALCLWGLARRGNARARLALHLAGGVALFIATLAHPALGVIGALLGLHEIMERRLLQNLRRGRLIASNLGFIVFVFCWLALGLHWLGTGALTEWMRRMADFPSLRGALPTGFFPRFLAAPFFHSTLALGATVAILICLLVKSRMSGAQAAARTSASMALVLVVSLLGVFIEEPQKLPYGFAMSALLLIGSRLLPVRVPAFRTDASLRFLFVASGVGAVALASVSFYFSPLRSWVSGILALPFAFSVGLALLLQANSDRLATLLLRLVTPALALTAACFARNHFMLIQRDASPAALTTTFSAPRLRGIRSTPERTQAVGALHDYLAPRLSYGEPLLAYDDCPMLYFILDAKPAYNLTWAVRYTRSVDDLRKLDEEFRSVPLPRYAIRTLVNISYASWKTAPPTSYANYPLNQTVESFYVLEKTIFPFQIFRLKIDAPSPPSFQNITPPAHSPPRPPGQLPHP